MEDIKTWNAEDVQKQYELRRARHIRQGATCLWCGEYIYDKCDVSGGISPSWATEDEDFGCDMSPDTTEDGVGSHNASTDPEIWAAGKSVE